MRKLFMIVLLLLAFRSQLLAKLHPIYVQKCLDSAKTIKTIVILRYHDSSMYYRYLNSTDTLKTTCTELGRHFSNKEDSFNNNKPIETLGGRWPHTGDTVLAVFAYKEGNILFFGKIELSYYRLWYPWTLSTGYFIIEKNSHLQPLSNGCSEWSDGKSWFCNDGCLVLKSYLKER